MTRASRLLRAAVTAAWRLPTFAPNPPCPRGIPSPARHPRRRLVAPCIGRPAGIAGGMADDRGLLDELEEMLAPEGGEGWAGRASLAAELRRLAEACDAAEDGGEAASHLLVGMEDEANRPSKRQRRQRGRPFSMSKYRTRFIALKIIYLGWRYHGLAAQAHMNQTVEAELFYALRRTRLIAEDADSKSVFYSRSGRTDKGVSALCQVVSLCVRSKGDAEGPEVDVTDELDYPAVLNSCLPPDIRVVGWTPVDKDFNARFDAKYREYKYFIVSQRHSPLDVAAMQQAAGLFCGTHDFRNFCKVNIEAMKNHVREVMECRVEPLALPEWGDRDFHVLTVRGTGFLWHQVRCMAAVLLMVGQGLEGPETVQRMLDVRDVAGKPSYAMASEIPLVLTNVGYEPNLQFIQSRLADSRVYTSMQDILDRSLIGAVLVQHTLSSLANFGPGAKDAPSRFLGAHAPLLDRQREASVEEKLRQEEAKRDAREGEVGGEGADGTAGEGSGCTEEEQDNVATA
ncbi:unnamed protein product [Ostreobium quekettii]|uniref:Pseudouridine synthase I TruA alpha/beta domain-containing protein n=1 Tax=Ostreobium quekettii TaxID=121088 RepID=A0A8S1IU59_9CHLO|nr:unnamed protein product [Ostreobium quekettii]|eukprot:evm.model.scf_16.15 EVM.evm.TU.scf_16.15   scf_16:170746-179588(+)